MTAFPFEQTWYQGDQHYSQELQFHPDGTGLWMTGGMGSDPPYKHVEFQWQRDASTLTAVTDGERRTVGYEIEPYDSFCMLVFDGNFLGDEQLSSHYTDTP